MFYFENFPAVLYDVKKNGKNEILTNVMLRFKIVEILQSSTAVYYNYSIKDSDRPDIIADKYYEDSRLDWLIFLINNILDPLWDWPLTYENFENYIRLKYGSVSTAKTTVSHYLKIVSNAQVLFDRTVVPKRTLEVDLTTYNSLPANEREIVYAYDHEFNLNEEKRNIQILDKKYLQPILTQIRNVF